MPTTHSHFIEEEQRSGEVTETPVTEETLEVPIIPKAIGQEISF